MQDQHSFVGEVGMGGSSKSLSVLAVLMLKRCRISTNTSHKSTIVYWGIQLSHTHLFSKYILVHWIILNIQRLLKSILPFQIQLQCLLTWCSLQHAHFRLLEKGSVAEFLSNELESVENSIKMHLQPRWGKILTESNNKLYLWCEESLYPTGQVRFVKDSADWRPFSGVALKQLCQERAEFLGVVNRHRRIWAANDLQD